MITKKFNAVFSKIIMLKTTYVDVSNEIRCISYDICPLLIKLRYTSYKIIEILNAKQNLATSSSSFKTLPAFDFYDILKHDIASYFVNHVYIKNVDD